MGSFSLTLNLVWGSVPREWELYCFWTSGVIGYLVNPQILCLQEVQEDHYWEQLEPSLRMMGTATPHNMFASPAESTSSLCPSKPSALSVG